MTPGPDATPLSPLPLRLEPFEEYLLLDQRPGYSMVFPYALVFSGTINKELFEQALEVALRNEPLLTAIVRRRGLRLAWVAADTSPRVEWEHHEDSRQLEEAIHSPEIKLNKEPGLRVKATTTPGRVRLVFSFHHACADGVAANRFVGDVMACYGRLAGDGEGLDSEPPEPEKLPERGELDITLPEPLTPWQQTKAIVVEAVRWLAKRPTPLATRAAPAATPQGQTTLWRRIDQQRVDQLRQVAQGLGVSLNDLMVRDLFCCVRDWNARQKGSRPSDLLQVLVPVNMRKTRHRRLPATNVMGYSFLIRSMEQCAAADQASFVNGISDEVRFIRDWSLAALFLSGLRLFQALPGALRVLTSRRICHATCVLSSLIPFHATLSQKRFRRAKTIDAGGLVLQDIVGAPPIRPRTHASLGVILHRRALTVAGAFDLSRMPLAEAERFLEEYLERLTQTAQTSTAVQEHPNAEPTVL